MILNAYILTLMIALWGLVSSLEDNILEKASLGLEKRVKNVEQVMNFMVKQGQKELKIGRIH